MLTRSRLEGMLPGIIKRFPVNSSTQEAQGQFSRRYQDGYGLICPSFQVTSVSLGFILFISVGVKNCTGINLLPGTQLNSPIHL